MNESRKVSAGMEYPERRITDSLLVLLDLSKQPQTNDRKAKLGSMRMTRLATIAAVEGDVPGGIRALHDGMVTKQATDLPIEPDNLAWMRHLADGIEYDRPHALRMIVDQTHPHDGSGSKESKDRASLNRSTMLIDQEGAQNQGALHDLTAVYMLPRSFLQPGRILRYNRAGVNRLLIEERKGKTISTGGPAEESQWMLGIWSQSGHVTDTKRIASLSQILTFVAPPTGGKYEHFRTQQKKIGTDAAIQTRTWFVHDIGAEVMGPLAMRRSDDRARGDFYDQHLNLPFEHHIIGTYVPLVGFLYDSKRDPRPWLPPAALKTDSPADHERGIEDNAPWPTFEPQRVWRCVVPFDPDIPAIEIPTCRGGSKPPDPDGREDPAPQPTEGGGGPPNIPTGGSAAQGEPFPTAPESIPEVDNVKPAGAALKSIEELREYLKTPQLAPPFTEIPASTAAPLGLAASAAAYLANILACDRNRLIELRLEEEDPCEEIEEIEDLGEVDLISDAELETPKARDLVAGETILSGTVVGLNANGEAIAAIGDTIVGNDVFGQDVIGVAAREIAEGEEMRQLRTVQGRFYWVRLESGTKASVVPGKTAYLSSDEAGTATPNEPIQCVIRATGAAVDCDDIPAAKNRVVGTFAEVAEDCDKALVLFRTCYSQPKIAVYEDPGGGGDVT